MSGLVTAYIDSAGIGKRGSCHLFRHTMATLMLEGGADIRFIQQMLGHSELSTPDLHSGSRSANSSRSTPPPTPEPCFKGTAPRINPSSSRIPKTSVRSCFLLSRRS